MKIMLYSDPLYENTLKCNTSDKIYLFQQYYIPSDEVRYHEVRDTLYKNIMNDNIDMIYLLNEKIYDYRDPLLSHPKVKQIHISTRLTFQNVMEYVRKNNIKGYVIIANADIFFDETLYNIRHSELCTSYKKMITQLRFEYNGNCATSPIFGPRIDSQDTWMFHTNEFITQDQEVVFNFELGTPACDNKMIYLLKVLGYTIINDPLKIKTYHNHKSLRRNYPASLKLPYGYITPYGFPDMNPSLGPDFAKILRSLQDISFDDNSVLYKYLVTKCVQNEKFIIPRIAGVENNVVFAAQNNINYDALLFHMKNNAGIAFDDWKSVESYSVQYLKAFENSDLFCCWELQGNYINHITQSHAYIMNSFPGKKHIWAYALDIFHYIHSNPWTRSLSGKRILIISPFVETMKKQVPHLNKIYNIDLFPQCTFVFIQPPQKQGKETSLDFHEELRLFYLELDKEKDNYDIALVSSGGNGNIICNYIFEQHNKSAIYVGGVLQMYFGILGNRWIIERNEIMHLYYNEYWVRPDNMERPLGYETIENSCYW
jgi:hypothetical protein